ncbi:hypothetical protein SPACI_055170 [Sporomusa acidovorans DSM 3132]|uniref:Uncharacterized protein n=1 Tax=Sporomusa acidovorans (strain ATCC 49682 / DSM 3132 / Mol) TaxID=1123286 RepID=A0ABZ3JAD4_SPOA4|nr:hypothetical protein SPACI_57730 [Sporomusa acidovorans DSM 3132]SDD98345.1 hypothetical protein SAMN04488499_100677 [Sporomusa acidovorans]
MAKKQEQCKNCKQQKNVEFGKEICPADKQAKKQEKCCK